MMNDGGVEEGGSHDNTKSTSSDDVVGVSSPSSHNHAHDDEEENRGLMRSSSSSISDDDADEHNNPSNEIPTTLPNSLKDTNIPRICCALLASIVTGGVTYAFGLYGVALKRTLHLTQTQLDTISSATFCAGLFSWLPGMFVDKFGTRFGISLGGVTGATSLMLYWIVSMQIIVIEKQTLVVTILSILGVTTFLSCALITGSVFKIVSVSCGPGTKGSAVGVAKGYVGLGSGAFACLFESIRSPTSSDLDFLPMGAFLFIVCATIPSFCFLETQSKPVPDVMTPLHFKVLFVSLFCLAVVVVGTSLLNLYEDEHHQSKNKDDDDGPKPNYFMALLIIVVWIGPLIAQLFLPQKQVQATYSVIGGQEDEGEECNEHNGQDNVELEEQGPLNHRRPSQVEGGETSGSHNPDTEEEDITDTDELISNEQSSPGGSHEQQVPDRNLFQMLQTATAWILLWISTIIVGGGTVETNNMGQMVESLKFPSVVASASLALFSVAQSAGRVLTGVISESALNWNTGKCCINKGVPRPFFLIVASAIGVLAHTILAFSTDQTSFVLGTALSGLSFGGVWPMLVLIVGETFGTAHVAANYMFYDGVTSAGGTFLLSKIVAQRVYENHIVHQDETSETANLLDSSFGNSDEVTCYGQECFQTTHVIISLLLCTCVVISGIFMYLTRHVYNKEDLHTHH